MSTKHERIQASAAEAEAIDNLIIQQNNAKIIAQAMDDAIVRALEKVGLAAERYAKELCPVDTGRLRNSITHVISNDGKFVAIGTNVEYARAVEFGVKSQNRPAQPFLVPAAEQHADQYRSIIESELGKG